MAVHMFASPDLVASIGFILGFYWLHPYSFSKQGFHAADFRPIRGGEQALQPGTRHAVDGNFPCERVRGPQEPRETATNHGGSI